MPIPGSGRERGGGGGRQGSRKTGRQAGRQARREEGEAGVLLFTGRLTGAGVARAQKDDRAHNRW